MATGPAEIKQFTKKQINRVASTGFDFNMLFILLLIVAFGLIMVYSASSYVAVSRYGNDRAFFFKKQMVMNLFGFVVMLITTFFPFKWYNKFGWERWAAWVGAIVLPLLTIPFGISSHNATRWIQIGSFSLQPAEISKVLMIIFMASWLAGLKEKINTWKYFLISIALILPSAGVIYIFTDNLSTALIIGMICVIMIFVASRDVKKYIVFGVLLVAAITIIIAVTYNMKIEDGTSFRLVRIYTWLHPGSSAETTAHQTVQALYAIGNGGIIGKGLGQSVQKISALPEPQNDMIFAVICEELGIVGAIALITMYILLLSRIYNVAKECRSGFSFMLVVGVFSHIAVQALLNIAVATNSMPNTGVSLPFVSYGGSSAIFLLAEMGIVFNIHRYNTKEANK